MRKKEMKLYKVSLISLTLLLFTLQNPSFAFIYGKKINQGNKLYKKQNYAAAEIKYREALTSKQNLPALFNLGNSLYRQEKYEESERCFNTVANEAQKNTKLKQKAFYNQGNAQFRQQNYEGAIKSYEEALKLNPKDEDARYNLELAKKMLQLPKNQRQQQKQNQQNSKQSEDKNKSSKGDDKNNQQKSSQNTSPDKTLPKEDAERLLKSIDNQLKHKNPGADKTQTKTRGVSKIEKDW